MSVKTGGSTVGGVADRLRVEREGFVSLADKRCGTLGAVVAG